MNAAAVCSPATFILYAKFFEIINKLSFICLTNQQLLKVMKKLITLSSGLLLLINGMFAGDNEKIFHSTGFSIYTDYMAAPATSYTVNTGSGDVTYAAQHTGFS